MSELWVGIQGYEGFYQVSNLGRVRSVTRWSVNNGGRQRLVGRIMRLGVNNPGYLFVFLCRDGRPKVHSVSRLVALAFIPNPSYLPQVNHKDGQRTNNHAFNLEWVTNGQNQKHSYAMGLHKPRGQSKTTPEQRKEIRRRRRAGDSLRVIASDFGLGKETIRQIGLRKDLGRQAKSVKSVNGTPKN